MNATGTRGAMDAGRARDSLNGLALGDAFGETWFRISAGEAERRRLARDREPDALDLANQPLGGSPPDHAGWMAEEIPFNAAQRTWERADVIVCGTPEIRCDPRTEVVVAPGPRVA